MKPQNVVIVNEAKGSVNLYHIRVEVAGVPLWTGVYAESVERANRIAEKMFGKGNIRGRPTKVKESKNPKGPHNKVKKGSQRREKIGFATDDPDKYIGKWEAYDEPQGVGSRAANVTMKPPVKEASFNLGDAVPYRWEGNEAHFVVDGASFKAHPGKIFGFTHEGGGRAKNPSPKMVRGIMATLATIIKDFLTRQKPNEMLFSGNTPSRIKMYGRLVREFSGILPPDYEIKSIKNKDLPWWSIQRKDTKKTMESDEVMPDVKTYTPEQIAKKHGVSVQQILAQLRIGTKVEFEHTKNARAAREIALDHLLELPDYYTRLEKMEKVKEGDESSIGPEFSRGLTNSSTGLGAVPPATDFDPNELPNKLRSKPKVPGSKSPARHVIKTVNKSIKNKVRKPNSPVTEDILNELFGGGVTLPYDYNPTGWTDIEVDEDRGIYVTVGFESINNYVPTAPPGFNVRFVTVIEGQVLLGVDRESLGLDAKQLVALFNTIIEIIQRWVSENNPDRLYFIAVEPMKNIYPRLLKKFVPPGEWTVSKGRAPIPMIGQTLDVYKVERKNQVDEMARLPTQNKFNADYEIKNGEKLVGKARVTDGVIEELLINQEDDTEDFKGHTLSTTLGTIIRDADIQGANLAMKVVDPADQDMKRFLERFGFRHAGDGVMKRTAGAITPPSVIEKEERT